ncbi:envelope stress response membrane protein PspC [Hyphococcus sp.]|uniref:envelope stress response membrane protein PspC n=1 Tax=Hyphococcus sp. TaxID=2038636 RepID=UPI003CCB8725
MPDRHYHHHHYHSRDRDRYAHSAGQPGPGPNFHRLRRDTKRGVIAGVCSGFSNYFGWNVKWVRVLSVLITIFFFPLPAIAYLAVALLIKTEELHAIVIDEETERFWRTFSTRPKATFSDLKHRFRALDTRIADLESTVTSDEYGLNKAFRDLERGV